MAVDMFLKIDDLEGESKDDKHKKWIDILAWSWGLSQSGSFHMGGGGGSGKANFQDVSATKYVDNVSCALMANCANGKHFDKGQLIIRKAGKTPLEYVKFYFKHLIITSFSTGGSGGEDRLTENVTMNFEMVHMVYTPQKPDGSKDTEQVFKWDIGANVEGPKLA